MAFHDRPIDDVQDELWRWDLQEFDDAKPIPHEARNLPMWLLHYLDHGNGFDKGVLSFQVIHMSIFRMNINQPKKTKNCLTGQESMTCSFFWVAFLPSTPPKKSIRFPPGCPLLVPNRSVFLTRWFNVPPFTITIRTKVKERLVNPWREQCLGFVGVPLYSDSTLVAEFGRFWRTDPMDGGRWGWPDRKEPLQHLVGLCDLYIWFVPG